MDAMILPGNAAVENSRVPPKVDAAFQYMQFYRGIETSSGGNFPGDMPKPDIRDQPFKQEKEVYFAALDTLRDYLSQPGFAPGECSKACPKNGDEPGQVALVS